MAFGDVVKPTSWAFNTCLNLRRLPSKQGQATVYEDMEADLLWPNSQVNFWCNLPYMKSSSYQYTDNSLTTS